MEVLIDARGYAEAMDDRISEFLVNQQIGRF
jgi:hypothetical protein